MSFTDLIDRVTDNIIEKADRVSNIIELEVLESKVIKWGKERGLFDNPNASRQMLKTIEEVGELAGDIAKGRDVKDSLGDVLVTLILQAHIQGTNLTECLEVAYNEISNRKGKTVNGVFIKEADINEF